MIDYLFFSDSFGKVITITFFLWLVSFTTAHSQNYASSEYYLTIDISEQQMYVVFQDSLVRTYQVSTSKFGIGNVQDSYCTPLGRHLIVGKFGHGAEEGMVFFERKSSGYISYVYTDSIDVATDFVTTRVLRLAGLEPGLNAGHGIDTFERMIYIHGTHEEGLIGLPASHGCIRMTNCEVIELFDLVQVGAQVIIQE